MPNAKQVIHFHFHLTKQYTNLFLRKNFKCLWKKFKYQHIRILKKYRGLKSKGLGLLIFFFKLIVLMVLKIQLIFCWSCQYIGFGMFFLLKRKILLFCYCTNIFFSAKINAGLCKLIHSQNFLRTYVTQLICLQQYNK